MLLQKRIECLLLANGKLARLNTGVVYTEEGVHVVHRLCADISELLDLRGGILDLQYSQGNQQVGRLADRIETPTSSSLRERPSCSTRDLTAFQPVRRCLNKEKHQQKYLFTTHEVPLTQLIHSESNQNLQA